MAFSVIPDTSRASLQPYSVVSLYWAVLFVGIAKLYSVAYNSLEITDGFNGPLAKEGCGSSVIVRGRTHPVKWENEDTR